MTGCVPFISTLVMLPAGIPRTRNSLTFGTTPVAFFTSKRTVRVFDSRVWLTFVPR